MLSALSVVCSALVGLVLLATGLIKTLSPTPFYLHLDRLRVLPPNAVRYAVGGSALLQCVLGVALVLRLYDAIVLPLAIGTLVALAVFTAWSWIVRGATDCGCYGGMFTLSPAKSLWLDVAYIGMLSVAWWQPVSFGWTPAAEWALLFEPALVFASVITMAMWVFRKWGQDMLILTPIQVNRPWNTAWLHGYGEVPPAEHRLIVLMSPGCSVCKEWIGPLNKIHRRPDMPQVVAAMAADASAREGFIQQHQIEFPLLGVAHGTMDRLVRAYPTVVEVKGGLIASRGESSLPEDLLGRLSSSRHVADVTRQLLVRLRTDAAHPASGPS